MKHIDFMEKEYIRFFEHVDRFDFTKNKQITKFLKWCCNNRFFDNMSNDDFLYFYENTEQLCLPLLKHNDITIGIDYLCGIDPNTSKDIKFCRIGIDPSYCFDKISKCSIVITFPITSKRKENAIYKCLNSIINRDNHISREWFKIASSCWYGTYANTF